VTTKRPSGRVSDAVPAAMARIATSVAEAVSVPVSLLGGYLEALTAVADTGRRLTRVELDACCQHGEEAVGQGVPLRAVVDAYLTVTWQVWDQLPAARAAGSAGVLRSVARAVLRAANDAAAALADGYERARRITVRREEALRREFIDDLLAGRGDLELLVERAERFGLRLGGPHAVAVATAEEPLGDATAFTRRVETEVLHRFGGRDGVFQQLLGPLLFGGPHRDQIRPVAGPGPAAAGSAGAARSWAAACPARPAWQATPHPACRSWAGPAGA
jgi:hypothetical protein